MMVLSIDAINSLPLVITVVVGTSGKNILHDYPTNVRVAKEESGLPLETVFLGFQIRSLDLQRFPEKPAGKITGKILEKIENTVRYCPGL